MKNNKVFIITLSLFIFLIVLSVSYYFISTIPHIEKEKVEQKKTGLSEEKSVANLQECLNAVKKEKEDVLEQLINWANSEEGKVKIKEENIDLSIEYENIVKEYHQELYNCYNKYS